MGEGINFVDLIFRDKKVLITGHSGFKGSWLSLYLSEIGAKVFGISLSETPNSIPNSKIEESIFFDIRNYSGLKIILDRIKPEFIFHLAANPITLSSYISPLETIQTNSIGTANILECLRTSDYSCTSIIITSDKCYYNKNWEWGYRENDELGGTDVYSASKSMAEIAVHAYYHSFFKDSDRVRIATCRAGNVIGGGDWGDYRIIPSCIKAWHEKQTLVLRNPTALRPWNYILDLIRGYLLTAYHLENGEFNGESFNFGPSVTSLVSVESLVDSLWELWDEKGFQPYSKSINQEASNLEHKILKLNSEKANAFLNWKTELSMNEYLSDTMDWYKNYYTQKEPVSLFTSKQIVKYRLALK